MKFNEDAFEAAARITAAAAEEAELDMDSESAEKAADFFSVLYRRLCDTAEGADEKKPGTFEVYKDAGEEFRFRLRAANGEIIAVSEAYRKKDACIKGVQSVISSARGAGIKEL